MAGSSPAEAVKNFVGPVQLALSCVTSAQVHVSEGGYKPAAAGRTHGLIFNRGQAVSLSGPVQPQLFASLDYDVVKTDDPQRGPWKVSTKGYRYHVLAQDGTEELLYHWHPSGNSAVVDPHFHLGGAVLNPHAVFTHKTHLPSGRIALEEVLQLLLRDFSVVATRPDAAAVIQTCLSGFTTWRTWAR